MKSIKAIIIENEKENRDFLVHLLKQHFPIVKIVGLADNYTDAKLLIENSDYDVIFLDIKLGDGNGFDLIENLNESNNYIVFVTAYEEFALRAFKFNTIDYLLKPVGIEDLKNVIKKLEKHLINQDDRNSHHHYEAKDQIAVPGIHDIKFLKLNEILFLESDGRYTTFYLTNNRKITSSRNLGEYEKFISDSNFFRVHNSYLVNLSHVKAIKKSDGMYIEFFESSKQLPIAKRRLNALKDFLNL